MAEKSDYKVPTVEGRYFEAQWPVIDIPAEPVTVAGCNYLTKAMATVLRQLIQAQIEAVAFQKTECWTDMTDCWKPFGCKDFLSMLLHTTSLATNVVNQFEQLLDYRQAEAWLDSSNPLLPNTTNTLQDLADAIRRNVNKLRFIIEDLTEPVWEKDGGVPTKKDKDEDESKKRTDEAKKEKLPIVPTKVPTVDLRCIRLWCVLNTKKRRQELENPKNTMERIEQLLNAIAKDIEPSHEEAGFNFSPSATKRLKLTPHTKKKGINELDDNVPMVYSICIGICWKDGKRHILHDSTTIGTTRERISSLPPYNEHRLEGRNLHVGNNDMEAWSKDLESLSKIDEADKGIEVSKEELASYKVETALNKKLKIKTEQDVIQMKGRAYLAARAINRFDEREPPAPQKLQALSLWEMGPRRDCSEHISRPFLVTKHGTRGIGGCFLCKVLIRFREPMNNTELHDGLKESAARKDFFKDRRDIPHSCAEVICSKYCHIMAEDKEARDKAEKKKKKEKEEEKKKKEEEKRKKKGWYHDRGMPRR
ncbi:uncharacterized protein FSUBG_760 [Fusarium subglutinans]|uniref:Uncharacterized protein n=1 Tax=Gibberella subglutinans TaxID=42677 RepID=A0A8H5QGV1_GIBSU|nr:uncharacterized protein FSUBG_760 [Fusarium subglutinans]KAF5613551.1 hypothetical protein FSUBG_760 [Fusarium subglutinans]